MKETTKTMLALILLVVFLLFPGIVCFFMGCEERIITGAMVLWLAVGVPLSFSTILGLRMLIGSKA